MQPEADLLRRVRARQPEALAELYDRYAPSLYAYIYRRVGERRLAEDLTADVFVRALDALARGRFATQSIQAWLYRLAHNRVVDHYRRGPAENVPLEERVRAPDDVPEAAARRAQQAWVRTALTQLTDDQQQILTLRFGEGLKAAAIAEVMGKSETAIRALQHRALRSLRRLRPDHDE